MERSVHTSIATASLKIPSTITKTVLSNDKLIFALIKKPFADNVLTAIPSTSPQTSCGAEVRRSPARHQHALKATGFPRSHLQQLLRLFTIIPNLTVSDNGMP
jgi:hypothetical protein